MEHRYNKLNMSEIQIPNGALLDLVMIAQDRGEDMIDVLCDLIHWESEQEMRRVKKAM